MVFGVCEKCGGERIIDTRRLDLMEMTGTLSVTCSSQACGNRRVANLNLDGSEITIDQYREHVMTGKRYDEIMAL
jgi:RNA polymerase-binding transcription factor DksA